jgi:hypothetical protein
LPILIEQFFDGDGISIGVFYYSYGNLELGIAVVNPCSDFGWAPRDVRKKESIPIVVVLIVVVVVVKRTDISNLPCRGATVDVQRKLRRRRRGSASATSPVHDDLR